MARMSKNFKLYSTLLRIIIVLLFTGGFVYQAFQFLFLYWTYPTVVDIQQSSPSFIEVPAFTFCNRIGYNYEKFCERKLVCANTMFTNMAAPIICNNAPAICTNGSLPKHFSVIFFAKYMEKGDITRDDIAEIAVPLEDYLTCSIEYAGKTTKCNMENVLGSFYSNGELPEFCYSIYSLWGQPGKKREVIPKGSTMRLSLFLNMSRRAPEINGDNLTYLPPLHSIPCQPAAQIAVHSPYFLPSPYLSGKSYLGGRSYTLRIKQSESHLLPLPYQTNCTDYMTPWYARNGKAPTDQLSMIQECRINRTFEKAGCIPLALNYPHPYNICASCPVIPTSECIYVEPPNNCSLLADSYNQACDSMIYTVERDDKAISILKHVKSLFAHPSDGIRIDMPMHDCEGKKSLRPECSTIEIEVPFDQFEITNFTYNPKFESLEVFSVIGGYMGMWLGISLVAVYDVFFDAFLFVRSYVIKRGKQAKRTSKVKMVGINRDNKISERVSSNYQIW